MSTCQSVESFLETPLNELNERYESKMVDPLDRNAFIREPIRGLSVLHVYGEVDIASAGTLQQAISAAAQKGEPVVVDLTPCNYIDSTVLTVLIKAHRTYPNRFWIIVPEAARVYRLFVVTALLEHLPIVETLADIP